MAELLTAHAERLPLKAPFRISRGVKTHADVVVAELRDGEALGRGECVPYARYGETGGAVLSALSEAAARIGRGEPVADVLAQMPAGAARNALDCAYWDLLARRDGQGVGDKLGRSLPDCLPTAVTVSLDTPDAMAVAAADAAGAPLLKVKLGADDPGGRLRAVAQAAPRSRLIVDPNEGWTLDILRSMADLIARLPVIMVEQPLPSEADQELAGLSYPAPLCADESVHTTSDVSRVADRYQVVNVKLDKAGGLTGAIAMAAEARRLGLGVLAGCMVSSSLAIAPALWIGAEADAVDLDGPWWLARDRAGGCRIEEGVLYPPQAGFWGDPNPPP